MNAKDQKNSSTETSGAKSMDKKIDKKETSPKREVQHNPKDDKKPSTTKK
ncbi:hypothetical protein NJT12_11045 [Flavobacterium sp. AC]|uniref:Uncharacterized protein n=1 Tax=Flavobacterium azizsancarii TaxID=2961580 RepID=A0ABT4WCB3_9FLAO|nr:hypothetical protein [Flavobacterium azizsancarii]MDA6070153.1 hypothetical protein [Flavobacterium azizsancarii]